MPPQANVLRKITMNAPQTTKPYTDGAGPHKVDQLAGRIDYSNTKPQHQKQGLPPPNPNLFEIAHAILREAAGCNQ
jgi:hypothetical protein